jgi:hypothetical protein
MWTPQELEVVGIPEAIAEKERVKPQGTVVWYVEGAPYATVECQCIDNYPEGLSTKLLDVQLPDLRPR